MDLFFAALGAKKTARIQLAAMDMWKPFRNSLAKNAPQARVIFDKFHIVRHLGDALDEVRRREYRRLAAKDRAFIKGPRYTLLSHREHLSLDGRRSLAKLLKANKRLNTAYLLKESFGQLWSYQTEGGARAFFERWRQSLKWQRLTPYETFAAMIDRHWEGIASYCHPENKVSLGLVEGAQQQDSRPPAPCLRLPRRGLPQAQNRRRVPAAVNAECGKGPTVIREDPDFMTEIAQSGVVLGEEVTTRGNLGAFRQRTSQGTLPQLKRRLQLSCFRCPNAWNGTELLNAALRKPCHPSQPIKNVHSDLDR